MIIEKEVTIKVNSTTKQYYQTLGYKCEVNDMITIKNEELKEGSNYMEERECDCCHKRYTKRHASHLNTFKTFGIDVCKECLYTNEKTLKQWRENTQNSYKTKTGYNNPFENPKVQDQIKQTNLSKYGCENPSQNPEIVQKREATFVEHFGASNPLQNEEIMDKVQQTNLKRYGCKNPNQNSEIRTKGIKTLASRGKGKTSSQQLACKNILEEHGYNVKLNVPVGACLLDVEIIIDSIKIDLEYDGSYWHQDKQKDRRRDEFIKTQGYKVIRIESSRNKIPTFEQMVDEIEYLLANEERTYAYLNLD